MHQELHSHALGMGMASERSRKRLVQRLRNNGVANKQVLEAMERVQRHRFVDEAMASRAYDDTALPIGYSQTISQPFVVAHMTALLMGEDSLDTVLEVGAGSGYQAAVLAKLVRTVYAVERIEPLYKRARLCLKEQGYYNVRLRLADGVMGLPDYAPFDGIMVSAGAEAIPQELVSQLKEGARMVAPIGPSGEQRVMVVTRRGDSYEQQTLDAVSFVPLIADSAHG